MSDFRRVNATAGRRLWESSGVSSTLSRFNFEHADITRHNYRRHLLAHAHYAIFELMEVCIRQEASALKYFAQEKLKTLKLIIPK